MTRLSRLQRQTLRLLADCPEGAPASDAWVAVIESLVKRGLVVATQNEEGPDQIKLTVAGEAIQKARVAAAVSTSNRRTHSKQVAPSTSSPSPVDPGQVRRRREAPPISGPTEVALTAPARARKINESQDQQITQTNSQGPEPRGKIAALLELLRQAGGSTVTEMMNTTGWQAHSVRGAISGHIKRKLGLTVFSRPSPDGRVYIISPEISA